MTVLPRTVIWRRPSHTAYPRHDCVEAGRANTAEGHIVLRLAIDTGQKMILTPREFAEFLDAAKNGEYDDLRHAPGEVLPV